MKESLPFKYSDNELKLIKAISPHWHNLITTSNSDFNPPCVYRVLAEQAFNENMQGPAVEALRRCSRALYACKPYRMTPEFDKLAEFDEYDEKDFKWDFFKWDFFKYLLFPGN